VQRVTMLATPDGEWVFEGSPEFYAALGDPDPDYDATLFAVKNLGFVKLEVLDRSVIEIELHPRNVGLSALLAVQEQLQSSRIKLFRIRYFDTSWRSEISSSAEHAMERLSELCAPGFTPPSSDRFIVEPKDYHTLMTSGTSMLQLFTQKWRMSFGHFDPTVISFAIRHQMLARIMIAGIRPKTQDPVFRFIGHGFKFLDSEFHFKGVGLQLGELPDRDYGGWLAGFYKAVASSGQPRYDVVTASIERADAHHRICCTRYERLLLPWKTPSGEIFVTLLSKTLDEKTPAEPTDALSRSIMSSKWAKSA
jgi:hypothetical protein